MKSIQYESDTEYIIKDLLKWGKDSEAVLTTSGTINIDNTGTLLANKPDTDNCKYLAKTEKSNDISHKNVHLTCLKVQGILIIEIRSRYIF